MLQAIMINDDQRWNEIVRSFNDYDVYHLPGYAKAFQLHGDGIPYLFYYADNHIRGINVSMRRNIVAPPFVKKGLLVEDLFDLATPYGYGGFLIEGAITNARLKELNRKYSDYCLSQNYVSEFVRFHPLLNNAKYCHQLYDVVDMGRTITLDLISSKQIWAQLTSKNRNVIRKARKAEVRIFWGRSPSLVDAFKTIYNSTMTRDSASEYYYFNDEFYISLLMDLRYNSMIFYAEYEKKIIAAAIVLFANKKMHYHLSGLDTRYSNLAPTNLLLYEAACWGCEQGLEKFHLGGGLGNTEDSLFRFKRAFNKQSETIFSIGKKIFDEKIYEELAENLNHDSPRSEFFPAYRGQK